MDYNFYMEEAIQLAKIAMRMGEVPIGCVIVYQGEIIGRGCNLRNSRKNPLFHGEIIAINQAAGVIGDWRLESCSLFVTVEPCPMCAGAIVQARIPHVVFGARNPKAGCGGSIYDLFHEPRFNHRVHVEEGIYVDQCSSLMKDFFLKFRKEK